MLKLVSIVGARPQFIKLISISRAIKEFNTKHPVMSPCIKHIVIHTGQHYHYNMNDIFFKELNIKEPDYNLGVGSHMQGRQTALMLERIEAVLQKESPHLVIVYGDTNSTLAGALAAKKLNILTAHIEAGLRSYNMNMSEEVNRVVTDRISDILFCPSKKAIKNLAFEGINNSPAKKFPRIFLVGDVMYDSILFYFKIAKKISNILKELSLTPKGYYLATVHRAENTNDPLRLKSILEILNEIAKNKAPVVFPVHPRTEKGIRCLGTHSFTKSLKAINPVSYLDMLILEKNARAILTDSGGVQKEAYFLNVPCITLRDETEWVETIDSGLNILTGTDKNKIKEALDKFKSLRPKHLKPYGDGRASKRIVDIIASLNN
jgi:UDP-N-acetylglucosamine 2-epimerase